jgi:hypothetical protein
MSTHSRAVAVAENAGSAKRTKAALARKLAVFMDRIWVYGADFQFGPGRRHRT